MTANEAGLTMTGRIDRKTYSTETLKSEYPEWDSMDDEERLEAIRQVEPEETETSYNVTTTRFHEYLVDNLDPDNTNPEANLGAVWMAIGTDSASGTSVSDTDLNNRVFSKQVTDHADNGTELLASTFVSSTEANVSNALNEIGLYTGDPVNVGNTGVFLINHATFSDVVKDENRTITFDVTLTFSDT